MTTIPGPARIRPTVLAYFIILFLLSIACTWAAPEPGWGKIELIRDRWGTPHVFAPTDEGTMYGLGYATAEDRGFQMTWSLRIIQGRAAEVLGDRPKPGGRESTLQSDRKMRTFGFYRAARETTRNLDPTTLVLLEAYSRGVNDSFAAQGKNRHPLFDKLGLEPEPWTPADCLASWWHLGQFFAGDGTRDLIRWHSLKEGSPAMAARGGRDGASGRPIRFPSRPVVDDAAAVIQRGDASADWMAKVEAFAREHDLLEAPRTGSEAGPKFSHSWVAGGARTGGGAVLMSDPQTNVTNPALFYEFHIQGKTFNSRGIGVPGSPALLIGWNESVAWGLTALGADQADLFMLKTDPAHPGQYQVDGAWKKMEVVEETIRVKGGQAIRYPVRLTQFGPVVSEFAFPSPQDPLVALRRIPVCESECETIQGALGMMCARDLPEFTRALAGWRFPSANIVFGDRSGAIGFWLLGAFPLRAAGSPEFGGAALDGASTRQDWQGFIPHDLVPHVLNPARGWLASANHRAIGSFYPLPLGVSTGSLGDTVRSWRLRELLEGLAGQARITPRDVLNIHYDDVNPARREIVRLGLHLRYALKRWLSDDALDALDCLKPWLEGGAHSDLNSPGAILAQNINTMFRIMQTDLAADYGGGEAGLAKFLKEAREKIQKDPKAEFDSRVKEYIEGVLADAWNQSSDLYGSAPAQWPERAREEARRRVLGYYQSLDGFGSLDTGEDIKLPPLACLDGGTIKSQAAQSYSQWVPLGEVDEALSLLPPGASERPGDAGRFATLELWSQGKLHPAPLSRNAIKPLAVSHKVLSHE